MSGLSGGLEDLGRSLEFVNESLERTTSTGACFAFNLDFHASSTPTSISISISTSGSELGLGEYRDGLSLRLS